MTDAPAAALSTASASAPPAATIDVTLPAISWRWRRWFCWLAFLINSGLWLVALAMHQTTWPNCLVLCAIIFVYVVGATSTEIVQLVQSSGIIRAAQSAATAFSTAADGVGALAGQVLPHAPVPPVPTTGGRTDLAS